jgi:HAMP domain-containing protein
MEPIVFMPTRALYMIRLVGWIFGFAIGVVIAVLNAQPSSPYLGGAIIIGCGIFAARTVIGMFSDMPQLVVTGEGFHVLGAMPVTWSEVADMDTGPMVIGRRATESVVRVWLHDPQDYIDRATPSVARRAATNVAAGSPPITISAPVTFGVNNARVAFAKMVDALRAGHAYASGETTITDASTYL